MNITQPLTPPDASTEEAVASPVPPAPGRFRPVAVYSMAAVEDAPAALFSNCVAISVPFTVMLGPKGSIEITSDRLVALAEFVRFPPDPVPLAPFLVASE